MSVLCHFLLVAELAAEFGAESGDDALAFVFDEAVAFAVDDPAEIEIGPEGHVPGRQVVDDGHQQAVAFALKAASITSGEN